MFTLKAPFAIISVPNLMKGAFTMDNLNLDMLIVGNIVATLHAQGKDANAIKEYLRCLGVNDKQKVIVNYLILKTK